MRRQRDLGVLERALEIGNATGVAGTALGSGDIGSIVGPLHAAALAALVQESVVTGDQRAAVLGVGRHHGLLRGRRTVGAWDADIGHLVGGPGLRSAGSGLALGKGQ